MSLERRRSIYNGGRKYFNSVEQSFPQLSFNREKFSILVSPKLVIDNPEDCHRPVSGLTAHSNIFLSKSPLKIPLVTVCKKDDLHPAPRSDVLNYRPPASKRLIIRVWRNDQGIQM